MNTAGTCAPAAHAFDMPMARSWHVHSELVNKCVPEHVTGGCECKRGNGDHPQRGTEKESTLTKGHAARQLALLSQAFSMHHCRTAAVVYALHPHHDINTGTAKSAMERTWALAQVHLDAAEYGKIVWEVAWWMPRLRLDLELDFGSGRSVDIETNMHAAGGRQAMQRPLYDLSHTIKAWNAYKWTGADTACMPWHEHMYTLAPHLTTWIHPQRASHVHMHRDL